MQLIYLTHLLQRIPRRTVLNMPQLSYLISLSITHTYRPTLCQANHTRVTTLALTYSPVDPTDQQTATPPARSLAHPPTRPYGIARQPSQCIPTCHSLRHCFDHFSVACQLDHCGFLIVARVWFGRFGLVCGNLSWTMECCCGVSVFCCTLCALVALDCFTLL